MRFELEEMEEAMGSVHDQVLQALQWDLALPRDRIAARVEDGWVTLCGEVDRPYEKSCAEADVRRVPGVVGVKNEIAIRSGGKPSH